MKRILNLSICLMMLMLAAVSCGSKVNPDELDKKIEQADVDNLNFTDDEYAFMIDALDKQFESEVEFDNLSAKDQNRVGNYVIMLSAADYRGVLKGDVKKKYEETQNKMKKFQEASMREAQKAMENASWGEDEEVVVEDYDY